MVKTNRILRKKVPKTGQVEFERVKCIGSVIIYVCLALWAFYGY